MIYTKYVFAHFDSSIINSWLIAPKPLEFARELKCVFCDVIEVSFGQQTRMSLVASETNQVTRGLKLSGPPSGLQGEKRT